MWRNKYEEQFNDSWGDLAVYNTQRSQGLLHTPEYEAKMAVKQQRYNREVLGWEQKEQA